MARGSNKVSTYGMENDWRADSDMRTLMEAEQIEADPKRLKAARAKAKEKLAQMQAVLGDKEKGAK